LVENPHLAEAEQRLGAGTADTVAVVLHGRDQDADFIREHLLDRLPPLPVCFLVPEATGASWYPGRFMDPLETNEPWLSWTLERIGVLVADAVAGGVPASRVALVGFSQGACAILEYAARHPARYGAIIALTGGLIGPPGTTWRGGSLAGTPVYLGTSDVDGWVPLHRVQESATVLADRRADVQLTVFEGMGHEICDEEVAAVARLLGTLADRRDPSHEGGPGRVGSSIGG
jgi:predicted esterase